MAVLVDSSVWIAAAKSHRPEFLKLRRLIQSNERICILKPIQMEVCQGARTQEQFHLLWEAFLGFETLELSDALWGKSAFNYFRARKKGLTLGTLDCLIGTASAEHKIELWTLDRTLQKSADLLGFDLFAP